MRYSLYTYFGITCYNNYHQRYFQPICHEILICFQKLPLNLQNEYLVGANLSGAKNIPISKEEAKQRGAIVD
jgi:hypothetical protein